MTLLLDECRILDAAAEGLAAASRLLGGLGAEIVPLPDGHDLADVEGPFDAAILELPRRDGLTAEALAASLWRRGERAHVVEVSFYGAANAPQLPLDELLLQAACGILHETGDDARGCCRLGGQIARTTLAAEVASAVVLGLRAGVGIMRIGAQAALAACSGQARVVAQYGGESASRAGSGIYRNGRRLQLIYEAADGLIVYPYHPSNMLSRLQEWIRDVGLPESSQAAMGRLVETGVFRVSQSDIDLVEDALRAFFSSQPRDLLVAEGQRRGLVIAPVNGLDDVLSDAQLAAQGVLESTGEKASSLGPPYRIEPICRTARTSNGKPKRAAEVDATLPLSGLRVVAFTTFVAGPVLGKWLADLGATVWRVETKKAMDFVRVTPPIIPLARGGRISAVFANINAGVHSVALDMDEPEHAKKVRALIAEADVILENSRPGLLEKWGLTQETLAALNDELVVLRMSGMGQTGPTAAHRAVGHTLAGLAGQLELTGWSDELPALTSIPVADYLAPALGLFAIASALHARARTRGGYVVDLSQFAGVAYSMAAELAAAAGGRPLARMGLMDPLHPEIPAGVFKAADGREFVVVDRTVQLPPWERGIETWQGRIAALTCHLPLDDAVRACVERGIDAVAVVQPAELTEQVWLREAGFYRPLASALNGMLIDGPPLPVVARAPYDAPLLGEQTDAVVAQVLDGAPVLEVTPS